MSTAMLLSRALRRTAAALLAAGPLATAAAPPTLTAPPAPGGDELWCGAYRTPPPSQGTGAWDRWAGEALVGTDEASSTVDDGGSHASGFIDIGLDGHPVRLFARDGASLMLGGDFASEGPARITLRMSRPVIDDVEPHDDEPSTFGGTATFRVARGGESRAVAGYVLCTVYDFPSTLDNLCARAPASKAGACAALRRSLRVRATR